jgi:hypothetical protein
MSIYYYYCTDCETTITTTTNKRCDICGGRNLTQPTSTSTTTTETTQLNNNNNIPPINEIFNLLQTTTTTTNTPLNDNNNTTTNNNNNQDDNPTNNETEITHHVVNILHQLLLPTLLTAAAAAGNNLLFNPSPQPASKKAIDSLRRFKVGQSGLDPQLAIVISPGVEGTMIGIPAAFGSTLSPTSAPIILANPLTLKPPLFPNLPEEEIKGKFIVCDRGEISFAQKALVVEKFLAKGLIVIQSAGGVWPFIATDSLNEGKSLTIPVLTISYENGLLIKKLLQQPTPTPTITTMSICRIEKEERICPICHDSLEQVSDLVVLQMPCLHYFHEICIQKWLEEKATCPNCRYALPVEDSNGNSSGFSSLLNNTERSVDLNGRMIS